MGEEDTAMIEKLLDKRVGEKATYTPHELGQFFGYTTRTIYNWINRGDFKGGMKSSSHGSIRIFRGTVVEYYKRKSF